MINDSPFIRLATDSGLVSEILHVSPVYIRLGPRMRGSFSDRRAARTRRTDARHLRRVSPAATADGSLPAIRR